LKTQVNKGQRVIVVHARGEEGVIPNALLMFQFDSKSAVCHNNMKNNYAKWLKDKLIPNLLPKSVLNIYNVPYHNVRLNPAPTSSTKKHAEARNVLTGKIKQDKI
jgi:hypothetical protein